MPPRRPRDAVGLEPVLIAPDELVGVARAAKEVGAVPLDGAQVGGRNSEVVRDLAKLHAAPDARLPQAASGNRRSVSSAS
jgi:hypothetical protein